jgi:uncharacterized surface protein with fasciclin (FAS1) repeats
MKTNIKFLLVALVAFSAFSITSCSEDDPAPTPTPQTITEIAQGNSNLSLLVQALTKAGLANKFNTPGTYTVFAPVNEAFIAAGYTSDVINDLTTPEEIALLKNVLENHVIGSKIMSSDILPSTYVSTLSPIDVTPGAPTISMFVQKAGSTVTLNGGSGIGKKGAVVTKADIEATNGVVHLVNSVILIPTLVDHVIYNPDFETLQTIVTSEGGDFGNQSAVFNALNETASATLFAPNNAAFTSLISELETAGIVPTAPQYSSVLQYHVVTGNVRSTKLPEIVLNSPSVPTLNAQNITFSSIEGTYKITGTFDPVRPASTIILPLDIQGSNGVIHTIDKVLLPSLQ